MDEMTIVREVLHGSATCPPESIVAARARLDEAMRIGAAAPLPSRRRIATPLRWSLAGTGLLAAAAVAAVVVGSTTVTPPGPTPLRPADPVQATAAQILLAAASRAERVPAATGKYWHVKSTENRQYLVPAGYHVTSRTVQELWNADRSWYGRLQLPASPSTPADEKAWRADGSPTEWRILGLRLSTEPQQPTLIRVRGSNSYLGENEVSRAELGKLPTEPAKLHAWLERRVQAQGGIDSAAVLQSQLFSTVVQLLAETPASPALRAAALRVLAAMPNVHNAGTGQDDLGRTGVRIVFESGDEHGEMIIDPDGPAVLAIKRTMETRSLKPVEELDTVIRTAAWTNDNPRLPTAP